MASRQKIRITKIKSRVRKTGGSTGYKKCNICGGTGRVKNKR